MKERKARREGRANWQFACFSRKTALKESRQTASLPYLFRGDDHMSRGFHFKLFLAFMAFACAASSAILSGAGARQDQRPAAAAPQQEDKPAEQVYKNIQVMKGMPASR